MKVLERMHNTHKDVISVDFVNEIRNNYKKYLTVGGVDPRKGLFADIQSKRMNKPTLTLSNDEHHDPEMLKFKIDRSLYKQYNIAAIRANGGENLPRRWKKLSPINRLKTKLKIDATLNR